MSVRSCRTPRASVEHAWEWLVALTGLGNAGMVLWVMLRLAERGATDAAVLQWAIGITTLAAALTMIQWSRWR